VDRVLITGGGGFIGSHLAEYLLGKGAQVHVVDDFSSGAIANVDHLAENPRFKLTVQSIIDKSAMSGVVKWAEYIYHLGASVGMNLILKSPLQTLRNNIDGTSVVLDLAARNRTPILVASTSEVYGLSEDVPLSEDQSLRIGPTNSPRWCYAASKLADEHLALAYAREANVPAVVVRFFNTVGPRQTGQYGMVFPRLVQQALKGEPLTVFGDGTQTRCFTYVSDLVRILDRLMRIPGAVGEVFNIGGVEEISILGLATRIQESVAPGLDIQFIPYEEAYGPNYQDVPRRVPSVEKLRTFLGETPNTPIQEIIDSVIDYERGRTTMKLSGQPALAAR
jgi:UDP-glucose 4-epimerase